MSSCTLWYLYQLQTNFSSNQVSTDAEDKETVMDSCSTGEVDQSD